MHCNLRSISLAVVVAAIGLCLPSISHAQFTDATPDELKMTALPEVPGASAFYLFKEETTEDSLHMYSSYARIKVLTEAGKKYGDIELPFLSDSDGASFHVTDIQGRTIHADGTVVPFTGKPYEKMISKHNGIKVAAKIFTLPDVQVGSIVEYRYKMRWDDDYYVPPRWDIQGDLYVRNAHYMWKPTDHELMGADGKITHNISYSWLLPQGIKLNESEIPGPASAGGHMIRTFDLKLKDIAPIPDESYMPPIKNLGYRVWYYYSAYDSQKDFWQSVGKAWSKNVDKFINADALAPAVSQLVSPTDSSDQKLRKIYAAMMTIENTDFTRERTSSETKASTGHATVRNSSEVWQAKRGSSDEIAELFVAMARAAHLKAYVMVVTDRKKSIFLPEYMTLGQLDDYIAIVNVDGKEQFFDPGARYCSYGHLAWQHTYTGGLRQTDEGSSVAQQTPGENYKFGNTQRVSDLTLDKDGTVSGPVNLTFIGAPALEWRQRALRTDEEGIRRELKESLEAMLSAGLEVQVAAISGLTDYENKLVVNYTVKGNLGSITGKRIILPADLFTMNTKPAFPEEKRTLAICFPYSFENQDASRIRFPAGYTVESSPAASNEMYLKSAANSIKTLTSPTSVTVQRDVVMADIAIPPSEYAAIRAYYAKLEQAQQANIVLTLPAAPGGN